MKNYSYNSGLNNTIALSILNTVNPLDTSTKPKYKVMLACHFTVHDQNCCACGMLMLDCHH